MNEEISIAFIAAIVILFIVGIKLGAFFEKLNRNSEIIRQRKDAIKQSRAVIGGQCTEQLAPYLPEFPADATEVRFIGKPIDFIAFNGSSAEEVSSVTFIEIKTGQSALSKTERSIKRAIEEGRVNWVEYRL